MIRRPRSWRPRRRSTALAFAIAASLVVPAAAHGGDGGLVQAKAYRPQPGSARWTYWGIEPTTRAAARPRVDGSVLTVTPSRDLALMGAGFAGDQWSFTTSYTAAMGPGLDAVLGFATVHFDDRYATPPGLRIEIGRPGQSLAIGTGEPMTVVPFRRNVRHVLRVDRLGPARAAVSVDGDEVWRGDPGWPTGGLYPKLAIRANGASHTVDVVPRVRVGFVPPGPTPASVDELRRAFVDRTLAAQAESGRYSEDAQPDAWTATALVLRWLRTREQRIAASLDRWATWRASTAPAHGAFPGDPAPLSHSIHVGQPGIALGLWAHIRDRDDWAEVLTSMTRQSGWTPCAPGDAEDWCRLGKLMPDGSVLHGGAALNHFHMVEVAAFLAAHQLGDEELLAQRRDWIRSLPARTYRTNRCTLVEYIAGDRATTDQRPWWMRTRKYHPFMLLLLGLTYDRVPDDPVWRERPVREFLDCAMSGFRTQGVGPMGWTTDNERYNYAVGMSELGASRLLEPLLGWRLTGPMVEQRIRAAWIRLADGETLLARGTQPEPSGLPGFWTSSIILQLDAAGVDAIP